MAKHQPMESAMNGTTKTMTTNREKIIVVGLGMVEQSQLLVLQLNSTTMIQTMIVMIVPRKVLNLTILTVSQPKVMAMIQTLVVMIVPRMVLNHHSMILTAFQPKLIRTMLSVFVRQKTMLR